MRFNSALKNPALRRWMPWGLYAIAAAVAIPLAWTASSFGTAPAIVEVRKVSLSCPRTAHRLRVEAVLVSPGQSVTAGQVLARMDPGETDAELAIARRKLEQLDLAVASLELKLRDDRTRASYKLAVDAERAALELTRLAAEEQRDRSELEQLEVEIAQEQTLVSDSLVNLERVNGLKLRRAGLATKVAESKGAVGQARRMAGAASQRFDEWHKAMLGEGGATTAHVLEQVAPARAAVEVQRDRVRQLEILRASLDLKAPFAGRVDEVLLRPGETAAVDGNIVTLVDDHPTNAIAYVDQRWAARVQVGDRAKLVPRDRSGPPLQGRVVSLGPSISELPVRFSIIPSQHRYGRNVYIQLNAPAPLPGQAFDASFRHEIRHASGGGR